MKKTFIICCEFVTEEEIPQFHLAVKKFGTWGRVTKNTWAIETTERAKFVRDYLLNYLSEGGRILVIKSGSVAAWRNLRCTNDWIKKHI